MSNDYEVGYKKPPKHTRFKKGQSGNLNGRPKGCRNLWTELQAELKETITVREGNKRRKLSKLRAIVKRKAAVAMVGNQKATIDIFDRLDRYQGITPQFAELDPNTQEVVDARAKVARRIEKLASQLRQDEGVPDEENTDPELEPPRQKR